MSRMYYGCIIVLLLALSSCRNAPAEAELPTPIVTFTPAPTLPAAAPTASPIPAPTVAPTPVITPTMAPPTVTMVVTATSTLSATTIIMPETPTSAPTMPVTATVALTPTALPTRAATSTPTSEPTMPPTATQAPTATSTAAASSAAPAVGDLPATIANLLLSADPAAGQQLTVNKGCTACHALEKGARLVGPSWYSVGATAGERVAGQSAEAYLYNSILHPGDYVVPDFLPNLMPANYADLLTEQELAELIAYLATLQGE